jgi:hypothetical protein
MNPNERAWSVIDGLRDGWCYGPCGVQAGCGCSDAIAEALRTVRREALEEAANLCEQYRHDANTFGAVPTDPMLAMSVAAHEISSAIRSLAEKEG